MPKIEYSSSDGEFMLNCGHTYSFEELGGDAYINVDDFLEKDHHCERCITEGRPGLPLSHELDNKFKRYENDKLLLIKIAYLKVRILMIRILLKFRIPYYISYCCGFCRGFFLGK